MSVWGFLMMKIIKKSPEYKQKYAPFVHNDFKYNCFSETASLLYLVNNLRAATWMSFSPVERHYWLEKLHVTFWEQVISNFPVELDYKKKRVALLKLQSATIYTVFFSGLTAGLCSSHSRGKKNIHEWHHWTAWQILTARQQHYSVKTELKVIHGKGSDASETEPKFWDETRQAFSSRFEMHWHFPTHAARDSSGRVIARDFKDVIRANSQGKETGIRGKGRALYHLRKTWLDSFFLKKKKP